jgi:3-dehydrosphinganine reductase
MKSNRSGHICFVSSAAGQCAIWGYGAYSPSKFAVRGLADVLQMELHPFGIGVSIVYPPNTDTEGYAVEKEEMPEEVRLISGSAGLFTPKDVAQKTVKTIENGDFATTLGLEGWMLRCLTAGASPEPSLLSAICQCLFGGLFRGIMLFYLYQFNSLVKKLHDTKNSRS